MGWEKDEGFMKDEVRYGAWVRTAEPKNRGGTGERQGQRGKAAGL